MEKFLIVAFSSRTNKDGRVTVKLICGHRVRTSRKKVERSIRLECSKCSS
jgi:hypothetical protein